MTELALVVTVSMVIDVAGAGPRGSSWLPCGSSGRNA
jgi:hypothetical protein